MFLNNYKYCFSALAVMLFANTSYASTLYGISSEQDLYAINTTDGSLTYVASLGLALNNAIAMTADQTADGLIMVNRLNGDFLRYDLNTRSLETITSMGHYAGVDEFAMNGAGVLYGVDAALDELAIYDYSTGDKTVIGPISAPYSNGLDFNSADQLYHINGQGSLFGTLNASTGESSPIGTLGAGVWLGLAFDDSDSLYTTLRTAIPNFSYESALYSVDEATAEVTYIAEITGFRVEGDAIVRLAYANDLTPVPVPAAVWLFLSGFALLTGVSFRNKENGRGSVNGHPEPPPGLTFYRLD